jgi:hypothetical protein
MKAVRSLVRRILIACALVCVLLAGMVAADEENPQVMSRFTMARIRFNSSNLNWFGFGGREPPWAHDYPRGERHFMKIMAEVTRVDVNPEGHIVSFENEEVFKYPIAYLCEVGFLDLSEQEVHNMSEYLLRGGFLIVDDFRGERELDNFKRQMKLVFPDRSLEELPRTHPIFTCFYDISDLHLPPPYNRYLMPQYLGMNDDQGRLMMVVDYNNDISEYWEWSGNPFMPIDDTNEAYKYGVNYVMYALTH